ncbi:tetratricopeptide repeat protein 23-like [Echinops telfairi]|uniref:Tetratricopeptide repeat protein 23-like n=1 Tax=Echinops telfairi TaxID=9371 RepID=A0ABM1VNJ7_ECHTE|nr:tetratricopeptide repeat protein 23-like [Echinops telfairi]
MRRKKMQASPIRIPTVSSDNDWDTCFDLSQQTKTPASQEIPELNSTDNSGESEEDFLAKEEVKVMDYLSHPKDKLAQCQKKIVVLIKDKLNIQANRELIRCVILSRIAFGAQHWKFAQALANLAYGYLTLRALPVQAKKHAESAKNLLLAWKGNTPSNKEKKEIMETLIMLYYTVGVAWLLQNHGREAYFSLQKAEQSMKELGELDKGSLNGLQVSENDVTIALGSSPSVTPQMAYSICVSVFTEFSPRTAEASALLAKAYATAGEAQYKDIVELYYIKSITAYQATLGSEDSETLTTIEEFSKWLVQNGKKQEAYTMMKALLKSQVISHRGCSKEVAQTFYNLGRICFAKGELRKAIQLLKKDKSQQLIEVEERRPCQEEESYMQRHRGLTEHSLGKQGFLLSVQKILYKTVNNKAILVENKHSGSQSVFYQQF